MLYFFDFYFFHHLNKNFNKNFNKNIFYKKKLYTLRLFIFKKFFVP